MSTKDDQNESPKKLKNPAKILLVVSILLFVLEYVGIIGAYWIFGGRFADVSLTISRYVGLENWSALIFCICNIAISILIVCYLLMKKKGFIWKFLMFVFAGSLMALSISPHTPADGMSSTIHRAFAGVMFITVAIIGILTLARTSHNVTKTYALLFVSYAVYFCISDALRVDYFMNAIFWFESAYLYAFFGLLLLSDKND